MLRLLALVRVLHRAGQRLGAALVVENDDPGGGAVAVSPLLDSDHSLVGEQGHVLPDHSGSGRTLLKPVTKG